MILPRPCKAGQDPGRISINETLRAKGARRLIHSLLPFVAKLRSGAGMTKVKAMIIQVGLGAALVPLQGVEAVAALTTIEVTDFTRDRVLFDAGQAVGRDAANVPVSGNATPGETVEIRVLADDGPVQGWMTLATADTSGGWSGEITVPRSPDWLRLEVRNASEPATRAATVNRFGVGHVIALWGQSELVRLRSPGFDGLTPEPLLRDDAIQAMWFDNSPVIKHLNDADPHTSALAAMANVFLAERPDDKFAIIFHAVSGTGFAALVDDTNPARDWSEDAQLHAFATADGQSVGMPAISWFAAPGGLGSNYGEALFPLFTGKQVDGTEVQFPATLSYGEGASFRADHWFGELYDPADTRWTGYGPHRFDILTDMRNAIVASDGSTQTNLANKQAARLAWREMLANPHGSQTFLPPGLEPLTYLNGVADGSGGWTDAAHPAGNDDDGAPQLARLTAHAILQASGLSTWRVPAFDSTVWEPSGAYVDIASSAGPVTTTRIARGLPPLGDQFDHWTHVVGWQINGIPANRVEIEQGKVRLYPNADRFYPQDIINFGEGGGTGMLRTPQDFEAGLHLDLPIVDVGAKRITGIPVTTLPDPAVLVNTLVATETSFSTGETGPYFLDPVEIGEGISAVQFEFDQRIDLSASGARTLADLSGNHIKLEILPSGRFRLNVKDGSGVRHLSNVASLPNSISDGVAARTVCAVDLVAGYARVWVDDVLVLDRSFTSANPAFPSVRQLAFLAQSNGASQAVVEVSRLKVWLVATPDGSTPLSSPRKVIEGSPATVNADTWKKGADAS